MLTPTFNFKDPAEPSFRQLESSKQGFLATWSVDVWICFTTCLDQNGNTSAALRALGFKVQGVLRKRFSLKVVKDGFA